MKWVKNGRALMLLVVPGLSLAVLPAYGQVAVMPQPVREKPQGKTMGPFAGTVLDPAGKPVAAATVWLSGGNDYTEDSRVVAKTTTDDKGQFKFGEVKWDMSSGRARLPELTARDSQGRIGAMVRNYARPSQPPANPFEGVQIKLQKVQDYRGRVTDTAGQPIPNATLRPNVWTHERQQDGQFMQDIIFFSADLSRDLAAQTGADGRFLLRSMPLAGRIGLKIEALGFGRPYASLDLEKSVTIPLGRPGIIRGSVACERDTKAAAGIKIQVYTANPGQAYTRSGREQADCQVAYHGNVVTQADGSFLFEGVVAGPYRLEPTLPDASPYYIDGLGPVEVKSGGTATVSLALRPAVKVQGKVVDGETGAGVAGVHVQLYYQDQKGQGGRQSSATTDDKGRFTLYCRPGKAFLQLWQFPDQYVNSPLGRQQQVIDVKEDATLEPVRLARATVLEGFVVDKSGKPVADAQIRCNSLDSGSPMPMRDDLRSDGSGKFVLKGILPNQKLSLRARTKTAAAEPVSITVGKSAGPVRLVLDEKTAFTVRGTVVDEAGQPVPKADVALSVMVWYGNFGTGFRGDSCTTDAEGKFVFGGLWAGDKYDVQISATGFDKYGSRRVEGTAGGTCDFGKIVMLGTSGTVAGVVVDSSGKPVAAARVFNSGDGAELMETRSDAAGKFRLQGFHRGPVWVFAEKDGYRFAGLKTIAGVSDAVVRMARSNEPARQRPAPTPAKNEDQQKAKSARKLLELLLTANDDYLKRTARQRLAAMDAKPARKNDSRQAAKKVEQPKGNDINKVAEEDVEEALSLVPQDPNQAYQTLKGLALRFADSDRQKALTFASEAIVRARSLDDPNRTLSLAELGVLASRLGNKEVGQKLVREAADTAAKWPPIEQREWQIASLAKTIAPLDLALALRISEKISKERRGSCLANIAMGLDDLAKAESVLKDLEPWYAERARARLACRIAAARPADAIRLVEAIPIDGGNGEFTKAAAFGWLAVAIAPKDPALAHSLIDRAFAIYLHPSNTPSHLYVHAIRAAHAALLAHQAQVTGYPDMQGAIYRVLALRPTTKDAWSPAAVKESSVMMAMFLALVDPSAAKETLQAVEPNSAALGSGGSGVGSRDWLRAWALVDPPHAVELFERELAAAKDENAKRSAWYAGLEMVEFWSSDPSNVVKLVTRGQGNIFSPDEEF